MEKIYRVFSFEDIYLIIKEFRFFKLYTEENDEEE